jgi:hypothetical protein
LNRQLLLDAIDDAVDVSLIGALARHDFGEVHVARPGIASHQAGADCPLLGVMVALTISVVSLTRLTVARLTRELCPVSVPVLSTESPD